MNRYNKRAVFGGIIAAVLTGAAAFLLGNISGYEAKELITTTIPGYNTLCNTVVLASATILTLLLTLLSISSGSKSQLKEDHYRHVLMIAKVDTVVFVVSVVTFQIMNIPITEAENISTEWYTIIYYVSLAMSSVLCGAIIVVVIMLYNAISNIITIVGLGDEEHPLIYADAPEEKDE